MYGDGLTDLSFRGRELVSCHKMHHIAGRIERSAKRGAASPPRRPWSRFRFGGMQVAKEHLDWRRSQRSGSGLSEGVRHVKSGRRIPVWPHEGQPRTMTRTVDSDGGGSIGERAWPPFNRS